MNAAVVSLLFVTLAFIGLLLGVFNQAVFVQRIAYRFDPYAQYAATPKQRPSDLVLVANAIACLCFHAGVFGALLIGAVWLVQTMF